LFTLKNVKIKEILSIDELIIPSHTVTCIYGPSGSGKSTLLKLLNHLHSPDEGNINFNGKSIFEMDPIELRRKVVMVPQTPTIYEGTVKDNLIIGCKFAEKPIPSDHELENILATVHLRKPLDEDADTLSGGEKQRLALARALLLHPEVLLLDEPTSALDEETASSVIFDVIQLYQQHKKTIIMITHSKDLLKKIHGNMIDITKYSLILQKDH
jgi:putative ABC transport system ATP-binding protein